jgi:predicted DNA-binding mobile mystery protein A
MMISGYQLRKIFDAKAKAIRPRLIPIPRGGWIKSMREALRMSQGDLAYLAGVQQSTIHRLEASELNKKIQLDSLEKLADAMQCDLYYAFIPRQPLETIYQEQALLGAKEMERQLVNTMALENQIIKVDDRRIKSTARAMVLKDTVRWKPRGIK